jgi:hypothetical protein
MTVNHIPNGDKAGIGVDTAHNGIIWDENAVDSNPWLEGYLSIDNYSIPDVQADDTFRIRTYLVEIKSFFYRSWNIDFQIPAGGYFQVTDYMTHLTNVQTSGSITADPDFFTLDTDFQTLIFNSTASAYYSQSYFIPPDDASSSGIAAYYSPVEELFQFEVGDIMRFESYFSYAPDYYAIAEVHEPLGTSLLEVKLDRPLTKKVNAQKFAILRRQDNETSVILDFNKKNGKTSTGLLIPNNLTPAIRENTSNIVAPLMSNLLANGG